MKKSLAKLSASFSPPTDKQAKKSTTAAGELWGLREGERVFFLVRYVEKNAHVPSLLPDSLSLIQSLTGWGPIVSSSALYQPISAAFGECGCRYECVTFALDSGRGIFQGKVS